VLLPSAAVDDAHHDDMVFNIIKKLPCKFCYFYFIMIPHHPGGPSFESSDAQNKKESRDLFVMEDGRSGGNHRAHVRLPDTQQRETNASVKTHNTVTQTRKQYSASHNKVHGFFTIEVKSIVEAVATSVLSNNHP